MLFVFCCFNWYNRPMEYDRRKRIIIISVYLLIFAFLAIAIYAFWPSNETCFDGVRNQNEEDIDCGGVCQKECHKIEAKDLIVEKAGTVPGGSAGQYDFFARISNPNAAFFNRRFEYTVVFLDQSGKILAERKGSSFIFPGERKYIVENNFTVSEGHSAELKILNSDWSNIGDYYERPNLKIINKSYAETSQGTAFSEAYGLLKNESPNDFDSIEIKIILKDGTGEVIALNSTLMKTVKSGEERDFRVQWPNRFPGAVENMEAQADVNIFEL